MSAALNEQLIREVVEEVLGRLGPAKASTPPAAPAVKPDGDHPHRGGGRLGVFQEADPACEAAAVAFVQLQKGGVAARQKAVTIVKTLAEANAAEWGRVELEETKIGRLDHKIQKLQIIKSVPGVEWLRPEGHSGDHGITLEEYTPFGVIGAITPSTHSIPTLSGNIVSMVAAGNAVVFNAHPAASRCAALAIAAYNQAIARETGIENLCCIIEHPTLGILQGPVRQRIHPPALRHRRPRRGQGGHAIGQAGHLRRAGQPAGVGGRHRLPETGRPRHHPGRGL